jgi:hypothetical protein
MSSSVELTTPAARDGTLTYRAASDRRVDLAIAALFFCGGIWLGAYAVYGFRAAGGHPQFYQAEFGPAVMFACGRGFQNPDAAGAPALAAFLSEQVNALDCADLPAAVRVTALNLFQRESPYLELTVALTWKLTGISWSRLALLSGALFGMVAALDYALLRLALSRPWALICMVPMLMSTSSLTHASHIRDYAKGPFILAIMLIMGLLVAGLADGRRVLASSAVAGAAIGLGLGFRTDLLITILPFVFAVGFLLPAGVSPWTQIAAIVLFLTVFAVIASPVLRVYSRGTNRSDVILEGLMAPFDEPLGIQPSLYEYGSQYNDSLAFSIINSYAIRIEDRHQGVGAETVAYERAAMCYLANVAAVFPADVVIRVLAAIRAVPEYFLAHYLWRPIWVRSQVGHVLYLARSGVLSRLAPIGFAAVAAATLVTGIVNPRAAWLLIVIVVGFAGASAIQFNERHFYYLEVLPWFSLGLLAQVATRTPRLFAGLTRVHIRRALFLGGTTVTVTVAATVASRAYQQRFAARLFDRYEAAPRTALPRLEREAAPGRTLIAAPDWLAPLSPGDPWIRTSVVAVQFRDDLCGPGNLPVTVRYEASLPELDFSTLKTVRLMSNPAVPTTLFLPIYDRPDDSVRFRGFEAPADRVRCIGGLFRSEGLDRTPLLLTTTLTADWRREPLYQRLR